MKSPILFIAGISCGQISPCYKRAVYGWIPFEPTRNDFTIWETWSESLQPKVEVESTSQRLFLITGMPGFSLGALGGPQESGSTSYTNPRYTTDPFLSHTNHLQSCSQIDQYHFDIFFLSYLKEPETELDFLKPMLAKIQIFPTTNNATFFGANDKQWLCFEPFLPLLKRHEKVVNQAVHLGTRTGLVGHAAVFKGPKPSVVGGICNAITWFSSARCDVHTTCICEHSFVASSR